MFEQTLRDATTIKRWGIVRTIRQQSLAEHQYYVALYAGQICDELNLGPAMTVAAVRYALTHDLDEVFTGDIPGPAKHRLLEGAPEHKSVLKHWYRKAFGEPQHPGGAVKCIVKIADELDAVFEMVTEVRMGNTYCQPHIEPAMKRAMTAVDQLETMITASPGNFAALRSKMLAAGSAHMTDQPAAPDIITR